MIRSLSQPAYTLGSGHDPLFATRSRKKSNAAAERLFPTTFYELQSTDNESLVALKGRCIRLAFLQANGYEGRRADRFEGSRHEVPRNENRRALAVVVGVYATSVLAQNALDAVGPSDGGEECGGLTSPARSPACITPPFVAAS